MAQKAVPQLTLNDGRGIPQLGFGVFKVPDSETRQAVEHALDAGYRSIDTAAFYHNEGGVGAALNASGIPREELFITSKVWNDAHGREKARKSFEQSLELLGLDRLDLFLIHWPVPSQDLYVETWQTLIELREKSLVTSIGVSNFEPAHLDRLAAETGVVPAVNQVELHPYLVQSKVREYDAAHGILTEAWSPLTKGGDLLAEGADRRPLRQVARPSGHPLAPAAGQRRHPQVGHPSPGAREPRRLRLRAHRLRARSDQRARSRAPHRTGPERVRRAARRRMTTPNEGRPVVSK